MSGNAKQRRKARRAAARAPAPAVPPPVVIPPTFGIYAAEDLVAFGTPPQPSRWLVVAGVVALVVIVGAFIFWVATIPAGQ